MQIAERRVAQFHYTLTNDQGEVLDSSSDAAPLAYLHGAGNIVPGLENALAGKQAGDKLKVSVTPDEGYGLQDPALIQIVPRDAFHGVPEVRVGMRFQAETAHGPVPVVVTGVTEATVTVDGNHPLAGQTLHFEVEITDVRDATLEELTHGHVHGPGGHHHHEIMRALVIKAGAEARKLIEREGFSPDLITHMGAAAGGPKGLILNRLDGALFGNGSRVEPSR